MARLPLLGEQFHRYQEAGKGEKSPDAELRVENAEKLTPFRVLDGGHDTNMRQDDQRYRSRSQSIESVNMAHYLCSTFATVDAMAPHFLRPAGKSSGS
jgi:hypothetical protein